MYMEVIRGLSPEHLMSEFNIIAQKFVKPEIKWVDETTLYIYGEEATPEWEQEKSEPVKMTKEEMRKNQPHYCCDCGNYDWRGGCRFATKLLEHMTPACEHFDTYGDYDNEGRLRSEADSITDTRGGTLGKN